MRLDLTAWKQVLLGVVAFLIVAFAVDRILGLCLDKAYRTTKYGIYYKDYYSLHESAEDILILGCSRTNHHYIPQIFIDSLGMSCYNCGSDGMGIYYDYAILASRIERKAPPKMVVYEAMPTDIQISKDEAFSLDAAIDRLAPDFGHYRCVDSVISMGGWKTNAKMYSRCYRYNSKAVQLIKCKFIPSTEVRGYEPLYKTMGDTTKVLHREYNYDEVDSNKLDYVNRLISICKIHGIDLFFVQSPSLVREESLGMDLMMKLALDYSIPFFDYVDDTNFVKPQYFNDWVHLNDQGAQCFSKEIVSRIKKYYQ